jgi:hypothetical protein
MQGRDRSPPEQAAEEVHQVTGRSLAQIRSRLFELTGTIYLSHVLHLLVSNLLVQSVAREPEILSRGASFLAPSPIRASFRHDGNVFVKV